MSLDHRVSSQERATSDFASNLLQVSSGVQERVSRFLGESTEALRERLCREIQHHFDGERLELLQRNASFADSFRDELSRSQREFEDRIVQMVTERILPPTLAASSEQRTGELQSMWYTFQEANQTQLGEIKRGFITEAMNRVGTVMKDSQSKAKDFERKAEWLAQQFGQIGQAMHSLKDVEIVQLRSQVSSLEAAVHQLASAQMGIQSAQQGVEKRVNEKDEASRLREELGGMKVRMQTLESSVKERATLPPPFLNAGDSRWTSQAVSGNSNQTNPLSKRSAMEPMGPRQSQQLQEQYQSQTLERCLQQPTLLQHSPSHSVPPHVDAVASLARGRAEPFEACTFNSANQGYSIVPPSFQGRSSLENPPVNPPPATFWVGSPTAGQMMLPSLVAAPQASVHWEPGLRSPVGGLASPGSESVVSRGPEMRPGELVLVQKKGFGKRTSIPLPPSGNLETREFRHIERGGTRSGFDVLSAMSDPVQMVMAQNSKAPKLTNPTEEWCDFKARFELFIQSSPQPEQLPDNVLYAVLNGCVPEGMRLEIQTARDEDREFQEFWCSWDARYSIFQEQILRRRLEECTLKGTRMNSDVWRDFSSSLHATGNFWGH
jgi:hypothetical protein